MGRKGFRRIGGVVIAAAAVGLGVGVWQGGVIGGGGGPPPPVGTANLWVDTNGGSCTRQSTPATYVDSSACASFQLAYNAANSGDTVLVKAGSYDVGITGGFTKTDWVSFSPAAGENVTASDGIGIHSVYVRLTDIHLGSTGQGIAVTSADGYGSNRVHHVQIINFGSGHSMTVTADDVLIQNGSLGGFDACSGGEDIARIWEQRQTISPDVYKGDHRVTFDHLYLHNLTQSSEGCSGYHSDCLQILSGFQITITNSQFIHCWHSDMISRPYRDPPLTDLVVANNYFTAVDSPGSGVYLGSGASNDPCAGTFVFRNNTLYGTYMASMCNGVTTTFTGNICGSAAQCLTPDGSPTYSYNTFTSGSLGTNAVTCTPSFQADGYHLTAGDTCANNHGNPANYTPADIDGDPRPFTTGTPDAGADEYCTGQTCGTGTPPSAPASTSPPTITGSLEVNTQLTAGVGSWTGNPTPTYTYQWQRCTTSSAGSCSNIAATSSTYTLVAGDQDIWIRVGVTATNTQGNATSYSALSGPIQPPPPPGTFQFGEQNILGTNNTGDGGLLIAQTASFVQSGAHTVSISFYVSTAAGNMRLGIYSDNAGTPGTLQAQAEIVGLTTGWNTANLPNVDLAAGTYWLAHLEQSSSVVDVKAVSGTSSGKFCTAAIGYVTMPSTWNCATSATTSHWSEYATMNNG